MACELQIDFLTPTIVILFSDVIRTMTGSKSNKRKASAAAGDGKSRGDRRSADIDRRSVDNDRRREDRDDKGGGGDHRPSVFSRLGNKVGGNVQTKFIQVISRIVRKV